MCNIRHILRLHTQGVGFFEIIKQTDVQRDQLKKYIDDFQKNGLTFEEINELSDNDLKELFQKPIEKPLNPALKTLLELLPGMEKGFKTGNVTRKNIWDNYIALHPDGYNYPAFVYHFRKWMTRGKPVLHKEHKHGDKMYIDFAGQKLSVIDKTTDEEKNVEVFVAILGASQYTYVEAVTTQRKEDFISACENALQFYGGVPGAIVCDNLRAAVKRTSRYEPSINETFADFGEYYNTAILPARPYKPTDKAPVEIAIRIIYGRIYAKLKDMKFFSLEELNKTIRGALEEHNNLPLTGKPYSRSQLFNEKEKPTLLPLPVLRYEFKKMAFKEVPRHCHVCLSSDKHYYSVPYQYIGKTVKMFYSNQKVEVFYRYECIASHERDRTPFILKENRCEKKA